MHVRRIVALPGVALALVCGELRAQSLSWDTNTATAGAQGGSGNWTGNNFWFDGTNNVTWTNNSTAIFGGTAGTVTVNSGILVNGIALNVNGYVVDGASTLTLVGPTIAMPNGTDQATISAPLGGSVGLTKLGPGTLTLTGASTFSGTLAINAGVIAVANLADTSVPNPLGVGNLSFDGGTLRLTATTGSSTNRSVVLNPGSGTVDVPSFSPLYTFSGAINGPGGLTKSGAGILSLTGNSNFTGPVTVTGGDLHVFDFADSGLTSSIGAGSNIFLSNNGRLVYIAASSDATNRPITLSGTGGGIVAASALELTGPISGTGTLQKAGNGTLTLSGVNTFVGDVFIGQNTLRAANGSAIPDTAGITFNNSAAPTFDLNNGSETVGSLGNNTGGSLTGGFIALGSGTLTTGGNNRSTTFNGVMSGIGGNIVKIGTGTQTFTQANTFSGTVAINAGAISVADVTNSGVASPLGAGTSISFNGGTLIFSGAANDSTDRAITLNASGGRFRNTTSSATLTLAGVISGPGALMTEGFLQLTGANTFAGSLIVDGGILSVPSVANGSQTSPIGRGSDIVINNGALFLQGFGTHSTDRAVTISGSVSLSPGNGTVTYSGPITGSGGLGVTGPGVLVLSGTNTFSGGVSVSNSTLRIANGNAIPDTAAVSLSAFNSPAGFDVNNSNETIGSLAGGSATNGAITLGSGTLTIGANNTSTSYDGVISGTGSIVKIGAGVLTLTRASTFTGGVTVRAGTIAVADLADSGVSSPLGSGSTLTFDAPSSQGILEFTGAASDSTNRPVTLNGVGNGVQVTNSAASLTLSGIISGTGVLGKFGPGTLVLTGTNTYSGTTNIIQGTLRVAGGNAIGNSSPVFVASVSGVTLDLNGTSEVIGSLAGGAATGGMVTLGSGTLTAGGNNSSTIFGGVISGTGGLTKTGTGTLTLSGANTYSGATTVSAGKLQFSGGSAIADTSPLSVAVNGAAEFINGTETIASLAGAGSVVLAGGNLIAGANGNPTVFDGIISGSGNLTKIGAGTLTLSAAPTYTGATNVNAGILALENGFDSAGGSITVAAAGRLSGRSAISRPIAGSGLITPTGTLIIGDGNSGAGFDFDGTLNVDIHQVVLADADVAKLGAITTLGSNGRLNSFNGITLPAGRTITTSPVFSASISGNLTNNGTINGPTTSGPVLNLNGDVTGAGNFTGNIRFLDSFSPGNGPGAVSLENFIFESTHTLTLELGGLIAGSQHDRLNFSGTGTLHGMLTVVLINSFQPVEGNTFTLLAGGTLIGPFDSIALPPLSPGLAWRYSQTPSTATLEVIPESSSFALLLAAIACASHRRSRARGSSR